MPAKSRERFERKVKALGEALRRLPASRQRAAFVQAKAEPEKRKAQPGDPLARMACRSWRSASW